MKPHHRTFKDYSIGWKLGLILSFFALMALINSIAFWQYHQRQDAPRVDAAGRNRMLSQRIGLLAERIVHGQENVRADLSQAIILHDTSLRALKEGGVAPGIGEDKVLPPTAPALLPTLLEAETLWSTYKQNAEIVVQTPLYIDTVQQAIVDSSGFAVMRATHAQVVNPTVVAALRFIEQNAALMLEKNNNLVKRYVHENREKGAWLQLTQLFLLFVNVVTIGVAIYLARAFIVAPLKVIRTVSQRLATGDLSAEAHYTSQDEIGQAIDNLNRMGSRLNDATAFAQAIGRGDFTADFQATGQQDTLGGALVHMQHQLQEIAQEDKVRNWTAVGLTQINELLRKDSDDMAALAQQILSFLLHYFDANQGACFIVNDEEKNHPYLELLAMHAWGRPRQIQKRIDPAEGMVGQAWMEGDTVYRTEIPEGYLKITSGLGKANPRSILIVPLILHQEVVGVIEMASFRPYQTYEQELLKKMGEGIAATFSAMKTSHETNCLLKSTQQQAEALLAQEEEMRQNMEELSAMQEEMVRKEQEYQKMIEMLKTQQASS